MKTHIFLIIAASAALAACTYADRRFVTNRSPESLRADSLAVQEAERAERAERRAERREEMMNEADAVNRAYRGSNHTYIIRDYY